MIVGIVVFLPQVSRTELIQVTRKKDSVLMRTVELWQRWILVTVKIRVQLTRECFRQGSLERLCQSPQVQDETVIRLVPEIAR